MKLYKVIYKSGNNYQYTANIIGDSSTQIREELERMCGPIDYFRIDQQHDIHHLTKGLREGIFHTVRLEKELKGDGSA